MIQGAGSELKQTITTLILHIEVSNWQMQHPLKKFIHYLFSNNLIPKHKNSVHTVHASYGIVVYVSRPRKYKTFRSHVIIKLMITEPVKNAI